MQNTQVLCRKEKPGRNFPVGLSVLLLEEIAVMAADTQDQHLDLLRQVVQL